MKYENKETKNMETENQNIEAEEKANEQIKELEEKIKTMKELDEKLRAENKALYKKLTIQKMESFGFLHLEWDSDVYREIESDPYVDDDDALDANMKLCMVWRNRKTKENIKVYVFNYYPDLYFIKK